jgi:hypothetical protein
MTGRMWSPSTRLRTGPHSSPDPVQAGLAPATRLAPKIAQILLPAIREKIITQPAPRSAAHHNRGGGLLPWLR